MDGAAQKTTVDTLISIEIIEGSDYEDIPYIKSLIALPLANADGAGGLKTVDLRGETQAEGATSLAGDLVDLHDMTEAVKMDLSGERIELVSAGTIGFGIKGAEHVTGGTGNDNITGNGAANKLIGGAARTCFAAASATTSSMASRMKRPPR
jgi:hypothetical protein